MPQRRGNAGSLTPPTNVERKLMSDVVEMREDMKMIKVELAALSATALDSQEKAELLVLRKHMNSLTVASAPQPSRIGNVDLFYDEKEIESLKGSIAEIRQFFDKVDIPYFQKEVRLLCEKQSVGIAYHEEELRRLAKKQEELFHTLDGRLQEVFVNIKELQQTCGGPATLATTPDKQRLDSAETGSLLQIRVDEVHGHNGEHSPHSSDATSTKVRRDEGHDHEGEHSRKSEAQASSLQHEPSDKWAGSPTSHNVRPPSTHHRNFASITDHPTVAYAFNESVWDASLFIGTEQMGVGRSCYMLVLLLLNLAMQMLFVIIVNQEFTGSGFDEEVVKGFERFRYQVAQDAKHLDQGYTSLADRICSGDTSVEMAGRQVADLALINQYLPDTEFRKKFRPSDRDPYFGGWQGPVMCIVSVLVWCFVVASELKKTKRVVWSWVRLFQTNRASRCYFAWNAEDAQWDIKTMSPGRLAVCCVLMFIRFAIATYLGQSGLKYIVHTVSLQDLVLNAMALSCVLDIDEAIFAALAPFSVQCFIHSLNPLIVPSSTKPCCSDLSLEAVCFFAGIIVSVSLTVYMYLLPQMTNLTHARDALCSGETRFVVRSGNYPPYLFWANSEPIQPLYEPLRFEAEMVKFVTQNDMDVASIIKVGSLEGGGWSLKALSEYRVAEASSRFNPSCLNVPFHTDPQDLLDIYRKRLSWVTGHDVDLCANETRVACNLYVGKGSIVRTMCPVLCGCDDPFSDLLLPDPDAGCPASCVQTRKYQAALANAPCNDTPPAALVQLDNWKQLADGVESVSKDGQWPLVMQAMMVDLKSMMLKEGCLAVTSFEKKYTISLCRDGDAKELPLRSFRSICPAQCNCARNPVGDRINCPLTCYPS